MSILPPFADLKREYPDYVHYTSSEVLAMIGGKVQANNFINTCAVRLSRTLNYNSLELPAPSASGAMSVVSGADKKWYSFRVRDTRTWLNQRIPSPAQRLRTLKAGS
jgi:hypothetical protein